MRYEGGIDHDTELTRLYDEDIGFGHCYNCDVPFNEDGPTCECEFKHVLSLLADQGDGRYAWRVHASYKTDAEAQAAGELVRLLNEHVKGFIVCQEPPDEDDDMDEEDFEDVDDGDDDEDADDMEDEEAEEDPDTLDYRRCYFCDESFIQDCWANRTIRKFYRNDAECGLIACEHCLLAAMVDEPLVVLVSA